MQALSLRPRLAIAGPGLPRRAPRQPVSVRAEEPRVTREYREGDDKIIDSRGQSPSTPSNPNSAYVDELPEPPRTEMSKEMKDRLRAEYYGLGGSPNRPMGGNYFLNIIIVISVLAILSAALGYLG